MINDVNVMKKDFVLDRRDGRVANAYGFNTESCAGDRVRSNQTQVVNGLPLLRRVCS